MCIPETTFLSSQYSNPTTDTIQLSNQLVLRQNSECKKDTYHKISNMDL